MSCPVIMAAYSVHREATTGVMNFGPTEVLKAGASALSALSGKLKPPEAFSSCPELPGSLWFTHPAVSAGDTIG
jgi:hypothetical protein